MLVPKKNRLALYSYLFKEGVVVVPKNQFLAKHPQIDIPNVQAMKMCTSLTSRGFVTERFNWGFLYYSLTDEGIEYLRQYMHIPEDVVPDTMKKQVKAQPPPSFRRGFGSDDRRGPRRDDRDGYRGKKDGAPDDFRPRFTGSRGGGRGGSRGGRTGDF